MRISDWSSDVCSSDLGKVTAHHGIIPTLEPVNLSAMSEKELAVYRLIRANYLAQFLPLHEFDRTTARFSCADQTLQAIGKQIAILGWRLVLIEQQPDRKSTRLNSNH